MITVVPYYESMKITWNTLQKNACNSTLLHNRNYMEYHKDRYKDVSLIFYNDKNKAIALFPACLSVKYPCTVVSHEGLTYGGVIMPQQTHASTIEEIYTALVAYYKEVEHLHSLIVKPIPYIYATQPCQEELYMISRLGGILTERHLSQAIDLQHPFNMNKLRQRCILKAKKNNIVATETTSKEDWKSFHLVLTEVLKSRHQASPVHSFDELWLLHTRFPHEIKLYVAIFQSKVLAGCVTYISKNVVHAQYLASSPEGFATGALDLVINYIIADTKNKEIRYLDFGVSTERNGELNYGLTLQKEGFGARGVCYDKYLINL